MKTILLDMYGVILEESKGNFIPFAERFYREYKFVLLSNDVSEWSTYITDYYQLNKYFRHKIVSGDVKCRKPDKKIFEIALATAKTKTEDCVFVDNSVENLNTAAEFGIIPVLFNRDNAEYAGTTVNTFEELSAVICQIHSD